MILPDVNVLLYAFDSNSPRHARSAQWLQQTRETSELGLVQTVLLGVLRLATHPRMSENPTPASTALRFVEQLRGAPRSRLLEPTEGTWACLRTLVDGDAAIRGNLVPDAWLAALAISHGARLATADRGFARFDGLDWFDPIAG